MALVVFEWLKRLIDRAFGKNVNQTTTWRIPKHGVTTLLVDKWENAIPLVNKIIKSTFTDSERASALVFNETDPSQQFDANVLDSWVNKRQLDPEGSTFVLMHVTDLTALDHESFKSLIVQLDLLNACVIIVLPAKKLYPNIVGHSDRLILDAPPRKFSSSERGVLYRTLFQRKLITYSQFIASWTQCFKQKQSIVVENETIAPWA